jgi:hypothetical protein
MTPNPTQMPGTAHTPGPWTARPSKYRDGEWVVQAGMPTNRVLAYFGDRDPLDETDIANARLIAAAPDLLSALEDMLWAFVDSEDAAEARSIQRTDAETAARTAITTAGGRNG